MAAIVVKGQKLMAPDDLSPANAIGVVQDNVKSLDLGMRGEEGFGLGRSGTGGADLGHFQSALRRSERMASKLAIRRSTWAFFVAGLMSIMLWKGAMRVPRLMSAVWIAASTCG